MIVGHVRVVIFCGRDQRDGGPLTSWGFHGALQPCVFCGGNRHRRDVV